jgi:CHAD domain-containing protein
LSTQSRFNGVVPLRLVRKEIGETVYQRENVCFRDAGRLLADLRESWVMIQTLDGLTTASDEALDSEAVESMRETLIIFYHTTRQRVVEEKQALAKAAEMIHEARLRVDHWPVNDDGFTAVAGGLRKIYKRGQNRLEDARTSPATETFHEWRKRVKYLWYSIRILQPIWPEPMAVLADEIHDLSDYLGDEHDLAELAGLITAQPSLLADDAAGQVLHFLIGHKRTNLQAQALQQGQYIYPEQPDAFIDRMRAYWGNVSPLYL